MMFSKQVSATCWQSFHFLALFSDGTKLKRLSVLASALASAYKLQNVIWKVLCFILFLMCFQLTSHKIFSIDN